MMTQSQNQGLKALPNVLRDQTVPNTLGGIGAPRPGGAEARSAAGAGRRGRRPRLALAVALAALLARSA